MKRILFILLFAIPVALFAQDDDPFATGGGDDDPFANPAPTPAPQPAPQPTDPFSNPTPAPQPAPQSGNDDPFATGGGNDDPFATGGSDSSDPFGGGATGPDLGGGGNAFTSMTDTLIQPLRPEFPWKKQMLQERQMLANYSIREADVFWAKTVWREIDIREKMNHPFAYPQAPFMTVLLDIVKKNPDMPLFKYDPFVDADFQEETSWADIVEGLGSTRTISVPILNDDGTETFQDQTITDKFNVASITRFRLKEVWYFDKKHSRMRVDIMGIAPVREINLADMGLVDPGLAGGAAANEVLFWAYYPDIREALARYETFNPLNDALRMSWDDLLTYRFFSSFIVKASNPLNQYVADYTDTSLDALYEGEEIKEQIFNFEHDLWSY